MLPCQIQYCKQVLPCQIQHCKNKCYHARCQSSLQLHHNTMLFFYNFTLIPMIITVLGNIIMIISVPGKIVMITTVSRKHCKNYYCTRETPKRLLLHQGNSLMIITMPWKLLYQGNGTECRGLLPYQKMAQKQW